MTRNPKRQSVASERVRYKKADDAFRRAFELAGEIDNQDLSHCTGEKVRRFFSKLVPKVRALDSECNTLLQVPAAAQAEEAGIYGHLHSIRSAMKNTIDPPRKFMEGELAATLVHMAESLHISSKDGHREVVSARARPRDWDPACPNCKKPRRLDDWNRYCHRCRGPSEMAQIVGNLQSGGSLIELRKSIPSMSLLEDLATRRFGHKHFDYSTVAELEAFARENAVGNGGDARSSRYEFLGMTAVEMVALLRKSVCPGYWDEATEACYKWVYEEVTRLTPYAQIQAEMMTQFRYPIHSINGVKAIAMRYATAHGLPMPPRRRERRRPS